MASAAMTRSLVGGIAADLVEIAIVLFGALFALRRLASRLGREHQLIRLLLMAPGGRSVLNSSSQAPRR